MKLDHKKFQAINDFRRKLRPGEHLAIKDSKPSITGVPENRAGYRRKISLEKQLIKLLGDTNG